MTIPAHLVVPVDLQSPVTLELERLEVEQSLFHIDSFLASMGSQQVRLHPKNGKILAGMEWSFNKLSRGVGSRVCSHEQRWA